MASEESAVGVDNRRPSRDRWVALAFGGIPAVTALGLAALYGVGALLKLDQLHGAHVSTADALPLVPLEQLLTNGITALVQSAGLSLVAVTLASGLYLDIRHRREIEAARKSIPKLVEEREALKEELKSVEGQRDEIHERIARTKAKVSTATAADAAVLEQEADEIEAASNSVLARLDQIDERVTVANKQLDHLEAVRRRDTWTARLSYAGFVIGAVIGIFVAPLVYAIGALVTALVAVIPIWLHVPYRRFAAAVATTVAVLLTNLAGDYFYPRPLPTATLYLTTGQTLSGSVIATTDSRWLLTSRNGLITSVSQARVQNASMRTHKQPRGRTLIRLIFG